MKISHVLIFLLRVHKDAGVKEFAESSEIHWDLVIESHQFRGGVKVGRVYAFVKDLDFPFD